MGFDVLGIAFDSQVFRCVLVCFEVGLRCLEVVGKGGNRRENKLSFCYFSQVVPKLGFGSSGTNRFCGFSFGTDMKTLYFWKTSDKHNFVIRNPFEACYISKLMY